MVYLLFFYVLHPIIHLFVGTSNVGQVWRSSVADPHHADADPDPAFHFNADPYPTFYSDVNLECGSNLLS